MTDQVFANEPSMVLADTHFDAPCHADLAVDPSIILSSSSPTWMVSQTDCYRHYHQPCITSGLLAFSTSYA